jgi:hypothetical protein
VPVVKCETCLIPSRISIRHNMTFCAACRECRSLKRLVYGLEERIIEVRLVEGVEIFLFTTVFRSDVRNTQTLTRVFTLCANGLLTFIWCWMIRLEVCPYSSVHLYGTALSEAQVELCRFRSRYSYSMYDISC